MNAIRKLMFVAALVVALLGSGSVFAATVCAPAGRFSQPAGAENTFDLPFPGGLVLLDSKRCTGQTQYAIFKLTPGGLYREKGSHFAMLIDSMLFKNCGEGIPYCGRGFAMFENRICLERFGSQTPPLSECQPEDPNSQFIFDSNATYTISVYATDSGIKVLVDVDGVNLFTLNGKLPDIMQNEPYSALTWAGVVNKCPPTSTTVLNENGESEVIEVPGHCTMKISEIEYGHF